MIRKRSLLNNISEIKRRKQESSPIDFDNDTPKDTKNALQYLSSIFPIEKFQNRIPRIIMRHQIYSFIKCRTEVDKCLNEMRKNGEIRFFKLGQKEDEIAVIYMNDYKEHLKRSCTNSAAVENFLNVIMQCTDFSFNKKALIDIYGIKEKCISELIQQGVLTSQDVGYYWLSIPRAGEFVKSLIFGRRAILQHIKRTKYKEMLQSELQQRKLPPKAHLGILYHIHDIIGADLVTCVETSTGIVLRLQVE